MTKFLIIGSDNARTYKEIFPLLKENKMWIGINHIKNFIQPDATIKTFGNISWFTNLEHSRRNEPLDLYKKYNPTDYPKYDNYDTIEVSKVAEIPMDYNEVMGVPITFLDKYCPTQFEILGHEHDLDGKGTSLGQFEVNGKGIYSRILIKRK